MKLQKHQESVLNKGDRPFALHGTGTGKTLTSLKFIERKQKENPEANTVLITSAALKDNLKKESDKHGIDIDFDRVFTVTHEGMARDKVYDKVKDVMKDDGILVIDEIHKLRNPESKGHVNTFNTSMRANSALGLTGTGIINHVDDLSNLYGLVQGKRVKPVSEYIEEKVVKPNFYRKLLGDKPKVTYQISNKKGLKDTFTSLDVYYPPKDDSMTPIVTSKIKEVPMNKGQSAGYVLAEKASIKGKPALAEVARKIRSGENMTAKEIASSNAFASQTSQAAISSAVHLPGRAHSAKIDVAIEDLLKMREENPDHRGVIYTNKISAGILPVIRRLKEEGLLDKLQIVQGNTNKNDIQNIVKDYNTGNKPILLISDSGAEGLDLKGTRSIQVLNPNWNDGKINQAIGRGARFGSHMHLPKEDRRVDVTHYHSVFPDGIFSKGDKTIDQYMKGLSDKKASDRDMVISVLQ